MKTLDEKHTWRFFFRNLPRRALSYVRQYKYRIALAFCFGVLFAISMVALQVRSLFVEVDAAFNLAPTFVPTRIYSDVTLITPPMNRQYITKRLRSLGYKLKEDQNQIEFTLREIDYPSRLVTEAFVARALKGTPVVLQFDQDSKDALLERIQGQDGVELTEIYLEPELIASLSRNSVESGEVDTEADKIREVIPFEDIPSSVWKAIIAIEDQHFLDHGGFDVRGILRAIYVNLIHLSLKQGGSTLTQQLVKNLSMRRSKNLLKKLNELFVAILLEGKYSKEIILQRYLNEVYLGQIGNKEVHGVGEGAKFFFGKNIQELNLGEIAMLAGLIRGPGFYSPYRHLDRALERQQWVLSRMVEINEIAPEQKEEALAMPIRIVPPPSATNRAPYFTDYVKARLIEILDDSMSETEVSDSGFRVYTTLDPYLNDQAQASVAVGVKRLDPEGGNLQGALASIDHRTGYVRSLVGGRDYRESNFNRILNMKRQVGSTFKPLVYLTAFLIENDSRNIPFSPAYPLFDSPWTYQYDRGKQTWTPRNYTGEFRGWVSFRTALAHSLNVPTSRLGVQLGIENILETVQRFHVQSDLVAVPSISLGTVEWSPVELLNVYATIANRGVFDEPTVIRAITYEDGSDYAHFEYEPRMIIPEKSADLMIDMLQSVFSEGTAAPALKMGFDRPAAGKTGTTSDYRDAWFAGFTPELTTVVWVGIDKGQHKTKLTGAGSALPIWVDYSNKALDSFPPTPFPQSPHIQDYKFDLKSGKLASSDCPDTQLIHERMFHLEAVHEGCELEYPVALELEVGQ